MDLFNNPMVKNAKKAMTKEQIDEYKKIGEKMYNTIDFVNPLMENEPLINSIAYINEALKSGLHYTYLSDNEKLIMKEHYGKNWFEKYNK